MRIRFLRAPGRSASSWSFIVRLPSLVLDHTHDVVNSADHAARRRRVGQFGHAADLVELQSDQRLALPVVAAGGAAGLFDLDRLAVTHVALHLPAQSAACSPSPASRRRACNADTLMLRRAATERGESWCLSASKVARTML